MSVPVRFCAPPSVPGGTGSSTERAEARPSQDFRPRRGAAAQGAAAAWDGKRTGMASERIAPVALRYAPDALADNPWNDAAGPPNPMAFPPYRLGAG